MDAVRAVCHNRGRSTRDRSTYSRPPLTTILRIQMSVCRTEDEDDEGGGASVTSARHASGPSGVV
jgi:hypothetical protein